MSLTNRWGRQNSLIRRVRQHGTLTTLFRTVDEHTSAPLTVGRAFTPPARQEQEATNELNAPFLDAPSAPPRAAVPHVSAFPVVRQPVPASVAPVMLGDALPAAEPVVMRATLPAPVAVSLTTPTPIAPLQMTTPVPLSLPSQLVAAGNRERVSPLVPPLVQTRSTPGAPTVPVAPTPTAHLPTSGRDITPVSPPTAPVVVPPATTLTEPAPISPALQRAPATEQPTASEMDDATWARLRAIVRKHQAHETTVSTQGAGASPALAPRPAVSTPTATAVQMTPAAAAPVTQKTSTAGPAITSDLIPVPTPVATPGATVVQPVQRQPMARAPLASGLSFTMASQAVPLPQPPPLPAATDEATAPPVTADGLPTTPAITDADAEPAADEAMPTDWGQPAVAQTPLQAVWPVQRLADTGAEAAAPTINELPAYVGPPPPELPELRRQLSALPTAQPTESSIDLVLPRRPRPVRPGTAAPTAPVTAGDAPAIQRQLAPMADPATAGNLPSAAGTVETAIGPLPADLWQLIGEKPPQAVPSLPAVNTASIQRAPVVHSPDVMDEPPAPTVVAPQSVASTDDSAAAGPPPAAVTMAETSARPMLPPLPPTVQLAENAFAATGSALPVVSAPTPVMRQMAHEEAAPATNGEALPTARLPADDASRGGVASSEKKTRSTHGAYPPTKTSRRRKRVPPT